MGMSVCSQYVRKFVEKREDRSEMNGNRRPCLLHHRTGLMIN
jgi:hypothetical protein